MPPEYKLNGREGKYLFKKAFEPKLPHEILYRPKMGFAVPLARWFRNELKEQARSRLLGDSLLGSGIFDGDYVRRLLDDHQSGRSDFGSIIWALMMFDGFQRRVLGSA